MASLLSRVGFTLSILLGALFFYFSSPLSRYLSAFTTRLGRTWQIPAPVWQCPHCSFSISAVGSMQTAADHLWSEHRHPAEFRCNGVVSRSGPSAILDRFVLRLLADRRVN